MNRRSGSHSHSHEGHHSKSDRSRSHSRRYVLHSEFVLKFAVLPEPGEAHQFKEVAELNIFVLSLNEPRKFRNSHEGNFDLTGL